MKLLILILTLVQLNGYSDDFVPYLTVLKQRSVMHQNQYDLEFLKLEEIDPKKQADPGDGFDKYDVKTHLIAPYGGVNYVISKDKLRGYEGVVGVFLAKGEFRGLGVAKENKDKIERITYSLLSAISGSSKFQFSGVDLRGTFSKRRTKYSAAYSFLNGSSFLFIPSWYRLRAGIYGSKAKNQDFLNVSAQDLYDDEIGIEASAAFSIAFMEFEFGVELGKRVHQAGWGVRPNASISAVIPIFGDINN